MAATKYPDRTLIRFAGARGWIWAGYHPAAVLGAWTVVDGDLVATIARPADCDPYWLRQPPLVLEVELYQKHRSGVTRKRRFKRAIRGISISSDRRELRGLVGAAVGEGAMWA
jgi:hypothetical protein